MKVKLSKCELRKLSFVRWEFDACLKALQEHKKTIDKCPVNDKLDKGPKIDEDISCCVIDNRSHAGIL